MMALPNELTSDLTTLICLFHHRDQAQAAIKDLLRSGIPQSSISSIDKSGSTVENFGQSSLEDLGVPARDLQHLSDGVRDGGTLVAVSALPSHVDTVEEIFSDHRAEKIDEADVDRNEALVLPLATGADMASQQDLPVLEEDLVVGKRTVDAGGVRLYRRVVDIPVETSVNLRDEHVVVERTAVDRQATAADLNQAGRTIELNETAEEAVVGKSARVVEEIYVGKSVTEHTEHIRDSVRQTEVEIEELAPDSPVIADSSARGEFKR